MSRFYTMRTSRELLCVSQVESDIFLPNKFNPRPLCLSTTATMAQVRKVACNKTIMNFCSRYSLAAKVVVWSWRLFGLTVQKAKAQSAKSSTSTRERRFFNQERTASRWWACLQLGFCHTPPTYAKSTLPYTSYRFGRLYIPPFCKTPPCIELFKDSFLIWNLYSTSRHKNWLIQCF